LGDVYLVNALSAFCDAGARDDIKAFFAAHRLPAASRTVDQTMERITSCVNLRRTQTPVLVRWLDARQ